MTARLSLGLALLMAACGGPTELVVEVDTALTPTALDTVAVSVDASAVGDGTEQREVAVDGDTAWPVRIVAVHRGGPLGPIRVTARGLSAGRVQAERSEEAFFVPGRSVILALTLAVGCGTGASCGDGQTCADGRCVEATPAPDAGTLGLDASPASEDGSTLPFDAGDPEPDDGGTDPGADLGVDGGPDAGDDAGTDAGPVVDGSTPCPTGCVCAASCEGGCLCEAQCPCLLTCGDGADCTGTCELGATCRFASEGASNASYTCEEDAECTVEGRRASNLDVRCESQSGCAVDCRDVSNCTVRCLGQAECQVECAGASNCDIHNCGPPGPGRRYQRCAGDVLVCGVACP
ncbi:MAG: hypothetical protein ACFCGT_06700 [Sandaracinaceae bacterium]